MTDSWQSYDSNGWGQGGKPKPVVPEPALTGAIIVFLGLTFLWWRRRNRE